MIRNADEARIYQLDGVRCLAVMLVLIGHSYGVGWWTNVDWVAGFGVRIFFVLSGFLITGILLRSQTNSLKHDAKVFYLRRLLRIFPLYYLIISVAFAAGMPKFLAPPFYGYYFNELAARGVSAGPLNPFWSLCVEEQFYLLCPWLIWKTPRPILPHVLVGLILLSAATGLVFEQMHLFYDPKMLTIVCAQFLMCGAFASWYDWKHGAKIDANKCLLIGFIGIIATFAVNTQVKFYTLLFQSIFVAFIILGLKRTANPFVLGVFNFRPFVYIGQISYGIYSYHELGFVVALGVMSMYPALNALTGPICAFLITILIATMSYYCFENPINKLKRHFPYMHAAKQPTSFSPLGT